MPDGRDEADRRLPQIGPQAEATQADDAMMLANSQPLRRLARLACRALHASDIVLVTPEGVPLLAHGEAGPDAPLLAHARRLAADIIAQGAPLTADDVPPAAHATARAARFLLGGLAVRAPKDGRPLGALVAFATAPLEADAELRERLADVASLFAPLLAPLIAAGVEAETRHVPPPLASETAAALATGRLADFLAITRGMILETDTSLAIIGGAGSEAAFGHAAAALIGLPLAEAIGAGPPSDAARVLSSPRMAGAAPLIAVSGGSVSESAASVWPVGEAAALAARFDHGADGDARHHAETAAGLDETRRSGFLDDLGARRAFGPLLFAVTPSCRAAQGWPAEPPGEGPSWVEITGAPLFDAAGSFGGYRCAMRDVTQLRHAEQAARALADSDWLTGLPNRRAFQERLRLDIEALRRRPRLAALILIDLDRFKRTNDTLGHAAGDALLREAGTRLAALCGPGDMAARIGGDEFAVIATSIASLVEAEALAARIATRLAEPVAYDGKTLRSSASLGVSLLDPEDNPDPDLSLTQADAALYAAKRRRRGSYSSFNRAMEARPRERRRLELDLRDAIGTGQLTLRYQPISDVPSGRCLGFEALLRWSPPGRGSVPPDTFIPLAEEYGLIQRIDDFVLETAMKSAVRWEGGQRLAVNVSSDWFTTDELPTHVETALRSSGLTPDRLEIEVTERIFIDNEANARTQIAQLKALGVRVALDDFGTGFSSLATLSSLPFDKVKLASTFIHGLGNSRRAEAVARAVLQLGGALGMTVCAEGVETEDQFAFLQMHRCDEMQGHLIALPVGEEEMPRLLAGWNARALRGHPHLLRATQGRGQ